MDKKIIERVCKLAALQDVFAKARKLMNDARPDPMTSSKYQREAYQALRRADHEAERAVQNAALQLAFDAPELVAASSANSPQF